ncbi:MAG: hypothetical protein ABIP65_09530, partial [Vicinamibacterales bacterium]
MTLWKTVALSSLLAGATGLGAAYAPVVYGQSRAPRAPASGIGEVLSIGHGSRLGVSIRDVDAEDVSGKSPSAGVVVDGVDEDSPAE